MKDKNLPSLYPIIHYNKAKNNKIFIYTADGKLLYVYNNYKEYIKYSLISNKIKESFIITEDRYFSTNDGVDYYAIIKDLLYDATHRNRYPLGASTITQQLIKNIIFHNRMNINNKIEETLLAIKLTNEMPKKTILTYYLNEIKLSYQTTGIGPISRVLFNKNQADLNWAESAEIASLAKGPTEFNPFIHPIAAKKRRNSILLKLYLNHDINIDQYKRAINTPLPIKPYIQNDNVPERDKYYLNNVLKDINTRYLDQLERLNGNIKIYTTLNQSYQDKAVNAVRKELINYQYRHFNNYIPNNIPNFIKKATIISIHKKIILLNLNNHIDVVPNTNLPLKIGESVLVYHNKIIQYPEINGGNLIANRQGAILAYVGGFSYQEENFDNNLAMRQCGSTIKPFIYLKALELGFKPDSIILDEPITIDLGHSLFWTPHNDDNENMGPITLTQALAYSRNDASVRLAYLIGLKNAQEVTRKFGIYNNFRHWADVLGAKDINVYTLTNGYLKIMTGKNRNLYFIQDIKYHHKIIYQHQTSNQKILKSKYINEIQQMLNQVTEIGTANILKNLNLKKGDEIYGKTGTSNKSRDSWFMGFNKEYVIGTHASFSNKQSLGKNEWGATIAVPIFKDEINSIDNP